MWTIPSARGRLVSLAILTSSACSPAPEARTLPIIGGADAAAEEDAAAVAILATYPGAGQVFCSGVQILSDVILTAGHCVQTFAIARAQVGPNIRFWVSGEADLGAVALGRAPGDAVEVVGEWAHPDFDEDDNPLPDVGLLFLADERVGVALPRVLDEDARDAIVPGLPATIVGWGVRASDEIASDQKGFAEVVLGAATEHLVGFGGAFRGATPVTTCSGDSGGPVLARGEDAVDLVVGIATRSDCATFSLNARPEGYWGEIAQVLADACGDGRRPACLVPVPSRAPASAVPAVVAQPLPERVQAGITRACAHQMDECSYFFAAESCALVLETLLGGSRDPSCAAVEATVIACSSCLEKNCFEQCDCGEARDALWECVAAPPSAGEPDAGLPPMSDAGAGGADSGSDAVDASFEPEPRPHRGSACAAAPADASPSPGALLVLAALIAMGRFTRFRRRARRARPTTAAEERRALARAPEVAFVFALAVVSSCAWAPFQGQDRPDADDDPLLDAGAVRGGGGSTDHDAAEDGVGAAVGPPAGDGGPCTPDECPGGDAGPDPTMCGSCEPLGTSTCEGSTLEVPRADCRQGQCEHFSEWVDCAARGGCCRDRCCEVLPTNDLELGRLEQNGLAVDTADGAEFDTGGDCHDGAILGDCAIVRLEDSPDVCVCLADDVSVGDLAVTGANALAIFAHDSVWIRGQLVVAPGAGVGFAYEGESDDAGGAGGSYGSVGGAGGGRRFSYDSDGVDTPSSTPSDPVGNSEVSPLRGGMTGGVPEASQGTGGGLGGGAVQITAGSSILVEGGVHVPGGGGPGCYAPGREASGGGSGGALLLEAPAVTIAEGAWLTAQGGGGGGGGPVIAGGCAGEDGHADLEVAAGGYPEDPQLGHRGGGAGATRDAAAAPGSYGGDYENAGWIGYSYAGGGGGGLGRIRINTSESCTCLGTVSPSPSEGPIIVE